MSKKVINCPHCGKILSPDLWKEESSPPRVMVKCPHCGCDRVFKDGIRHTASGKVQRYMCSNCYYRFSKS